MRLQPLSDELPLEQAELIQRLRWFIQLRWVFASTLIAVGLVLGRKPLGEANAALIVLTGSAILCYNLVFWLLERRRPGLSAKGRALHASRSAAGQIVLDLVALTVVLHAGGGVENPFFTFYLFHIVIATLLLPMEGVFALAGLTIVLFGGLALAELTGLLPHHRLFQLDPLYRDPKFVSVTLVAFGSATLIAVYFGTSIAGRLRQREREVQDLEKALAARADELEQSNAALIKADEVKTQYFRQVSHDLKSPLAAQQSILRALLVQLGEDQAAARERIGRAVQRGDELLALLNDLLLLSRARDVTRRPRCEWTDPPRALEAMLEVQSAQAREKGLDWRVEVVEPVPTLCAEPGVINTLAENIISNAIKYTPAGGAVTFTLRGRSGHLVLECRDTGMGMSREDLAQIGKEYFRTKQARDAGIPGTGLGLAIVRSMVENLKGELELESEPGDGTLVRISVPVARSDETLQECGLTVPSQREA